MCTTMEDQIGKKKFDCMDLFLLKNNVIEFEVFVSFELFMASALTKL